MVSSGLLRRVALVRTTRRNNPEDTILQFDHCSNTTCNMHVEIGNEHTISMQNSEKNSPFAKAGSRFLESIKMIIGTIVSQCGLFFLSTIRYGSGLLCTR
jgi:hypothetical protein